MKENSSLPSWLSNLKISRMRIWQQRIWYWEKKGFWLGVGLASGVLLISRAVPLAHPEEWAGTLFLISLLIGTLIGIWMRPSWPETIRVTDLRLDLQDRLNTAFQMQDQASAVVLLQREDAITRLHEQLPLLKERMPFVWGTKKEAMTLLGASLGIALLLFLPNPLTEIALKKEQIQQAIAKQEEEIEQLQEKVEKEQKASPETKEALRKELNQLIKQLKESENLEQATEELAKSEAKLNDLKKQIQQDQKELEKMLSEWSQQEKLVSLSQALAEGKGVTAEQTKQTLQSLTEQEKEKLAQQLQQLGQQWENSNQKGARDMARQLQQAAGQVASGSSGAAGSLSQALASATGVINQQQASQQLISQSQQVVSSGKTTLVAAANAVNGNTTASNSNSSTNPSNSQTANTGNYSNQSGSGSANGSGNGSGNGTGNGSSNGSGNGNGGGTGSGSGGSGAGSGSRNVWVPWSRLQGGGPQETVGGPSGEGSEQQGTTTTTSPGTSRPYEEVYAQYEAEVRQALERGDLPPELQQMIREYFSSIEP